MEERYKIHAFYILSILFAIIIILVSVKWAAIPDLVDYIAFALTLSSLLLAVLAIIYSLLSNENLNKVMHNLNASSSALKETSREISEGNRTLLQEIKLIPAAIEAVDNNITSTRGMLESISVSKDKALPIGEIEPTGTISSEFVEAFLKNSSILGLYAIYSVSLSHQTKTAFTIREISVILDEQEKNNGYLLSYHIATKAMGLFTTEYDGKYRTIVTSAHKTLLEKTENILANKLYEVAKEVEKGKKEIPEAQEGIEKWFTQANLIRQFFGIREELQSKHFPK